MEQPVCGLPSYQLEIEADGSNALEFDIEIELIWIQIKDLVDAHFCMNDKW